MFTSEFMNLERQKESIIRQLRLLKGMIEKFDSDTEKAIENEEKEISCNNSLIDESTDYQQRHELEEENRDSNMAIRDVERLKFEVRFEVDEYVKTFTNK